MNSFPVTTMEWSVAPSGYSPCRFTRPATCNRLATLQISRTAVKNEMSTPHSTQEVAIRVQSLSSDLRRSRTFARVFAWSAGVNAVLRCITFLGVVTCNSAATSAALCTVFMMTNRGPDRLSMKSTNCCKLLNPLISANCTRCDSTCLIRVASS